MSWINTGLHELWLFMLYFGFWAIALIVFVFAVLLREIHTHPDDHQERIGNFLNGLFTKVIDPIFKVFIVTVAIVAMALSCLFGLLIIVGGFLAIWLSHSPWLLIIWAYLSYRIVKEGWNYCREFPSILRRDLSF